MEQDVQPSAAAQYKALGLLPSAPRGLVEEVYWYLTQQMRKEAYSLRAVERLSALNDSYDRITHAYGSNGASTNGVHRNGTGAKEKRGRLGRRAPKEVRHEANLYEVLHVDTETSAEVVRVAASVLLALAQSDKERRSLIEQAQEVLANAERRAAYDRKIGVQRGERVDGAPPIVEPAKNAVAEEVVAASVTPAAVESPVVAVEPPVVAVEAAAAAEAAPVIEEASPAVVAVEDAPVVEAALEVEEIPRADDPIVAQAADGDAAEVMPVVEAAVQEDVVSSVGVTEAASIETQVGVAEVAEVEDAAAVEQPEAPSKERPARRGFGLAGWFARNEQPPEVVEAENARLLSLRADGELWTDGAFAFEAGDVEPQIVVADESVAAGTIDDVVEPQARARSTEVPRDEISLSFLKGRRSGEVVTVDDVGEMRVDLAGPGGGVQIRVWRSAGVYLLQQLYGPPVKIAGEHLEAPIVVLEDGDEIASGEHVLRFRSPD